MALPRSRMSRGGTRQSDVDDCRSTVYIVQQCLPAKGVMSRLLQSQAMRWHHRLQECCQLLRQAGRWQRHRPHGRRRAEPPQHPPSQLARAPHARTPRPTRPRAAPRPSPPGRRPTPPPSQQAGRSARSPSGSTPRWGAWCAAAWPGRTRTAQTSSRTRGSTRSCPAHHRRARAHTRARARREMSSVTAARPAAAGRGAR